MTEHKIDIEKFGSLEAVDEHNQAVVLSSLWQNKPAVMVFVRHFG